MVDCIFHIFLNANRDSFSIIFLYQTLNRVFHIDNDHGAPFSADVDSGWNHIQYLSKCIQYQNDKVTYARISIFQFQNTL